MIRSKHHQVVYVLYVCYYNQKFLPLKPSLIHQLLERNGRPREKRKAGYVGYRMNFIIFLNLLHYNLLWVPYRST